ncbi:hypothetical protein ACEQPO_24765 [Bacillus sp. SL00103]
MILPLSLSEATTLVAMKDQSATRFASFLFLTIVKARSKKGGMKMKITSKTIIGSIFNVCHLSIFFGGSLGGLIPILIGAWLIYVGVKKYEKGSKTFGVILAVIGVMIVVQGLPLSLESH